MAFARYLTPAPEHSGLGLQCLGVGWQQIKRIQFDGRVLDCYGLMMVVRGGGWFAWGDLPRKRVPLRAPAVFVVFPGVYHAYQPDPTGWSERWVLFNGAAARTHEVLGTLERDAAVTLLQGSPDGMERIFDKLFAAADSGSPHRDVLTSSLVHRLLAELLAGKGTKDLAPFVRHFDERATDSVSIGEHARRLGMDEPTLRREMLRATGTTPKDYILRTRINVAKRLLLTTDRTVADISRRVGYSDAAYFTRLFTRRVGQAPHHFRKVHNPVGGPLSRKSVEQEPR
ncbi:AraC family transcriptional regulator [Kitasatospora sp. NPDC058170]|uniref:helix-turn-helix transcriptional regulator n=1 Tax=Kitasatospora sp. NPDC058170 TaxID=3346364 RepID=UPI0036D94413